MEKSESLLIADYIHRLNNAAGAIRVYVAMLQMTKSDLLKQDPMLADVLQDIEKQAKNIVLSTEEFKLSFTSPGLGESISVKEVLEHVLCDNEPPQSVAVVLEVEDTISKVHATKNLADVFRNLITNAFEAMPDGGKLQVSATENQSKEKVEITFTDTGRGIPTYVAESLFRPYFSTKQDKGHGLGLWWSKMYLEAIGGNIELVRSEVGKGTCFLVSLIPAK